MRLLDLDVFHDDRGDLVALEDRTNLPFVLRRFFYMKVSRPGTVRANHATSADLLVTAVTGSAVMEVDNGAQCVSVPLEGSDLGVWTRPGVFVRLRNVSPTTVLLVCASQELGQTRYFGAPQPALIDAGELV